MKGFIIPPSFFKEILIILIKILWRFFGFGYDVLERLEMEAMGERGDWLFCVPSL